MAETPKLARFRRVAILTLLLILLATALGQEFFPNKGHGLSKAGTGPSGNLVAGNALTLLPLDRGVIHPGARGKTARLHAGDPEDAGDDVDSDLGFNGSDGLQTLVYRPPSGDGDKPQSDGGDDGDHGWSFGGGGAPGFGGGGAPGYGGGDPGGWPIGTDTPPGPKPGGNAPSFVSPVIPQLLAPVPEPATWTMLILGFGAVGATLRRARRIAPHASAHLPG